MLITKTWRLLHMANAQIQCASQTKNAFQHKNMIRLLFNFPSSICGNERKIYQEHRLVKYNQKQLYDIVAQTQDYSKFLPGCYSSKVCSKKSDTQLVELEIGFPPILEKYISEVTLEPPNRVRAHSKHGNFFRDLSSEWHFVDASKGNEQLTLVEFKVEFHLKSGLLASMGDLLFDQTAKQTMRAFLDRAKKLYGDPSQNALKSKQN